MKISDFLPSEGVCLGDYKSTSVLYPSDITKELLGEFICLNPLSPEEDYEHHKRSYYKRSQPRRSDLNVSEFRNFLFEMDGTPLQDQLNIFSGCPLPFYRITYSGSKSYHAVLSVSGGCRLTPHVLGSVSQYKRLWAKLARHIDDYAKSLGYSLPGNAKSFVDPSCKNPSRLTRMSDVLRSNGELQKCVYRGDAVSIENFNDLISTYPDEGRDDAFYSPFNTNSVDSLQDFWKKCPMGLKNKLRYVDWADSVNMYPELLKLSYWAIDSTGIDYDMFIEALWERTFPRLLEVGYPREKLTRPVRDAFMDKRRR